MRLRGGKRSGFTIIELLTVIAIIGVLASLLTVATMKSLRYAEDVRAHNDLRQLSDAAATAFMTKFQLPYIPSRLVLAEQINDYFTNPPTNTTFKSAVHQDSLEFLQRMWPRITELSGGNLIWSVSDPSYQPSPLAYIDWNGNGLPDTPEVILEGDQCLVFFLGGIPQLTTASGVPGCLGFSASPTNPAAPGGTRIGPFYQFDSTRLVNWNAAGNNFLHTGGASPNPYYSYLDAYSSAGGITNSAGFLTVPIARGAPYAYFSKYKSDNGYNRYAGLNMPTATLPPVSDCDSLGRLFTPTANQANRLWPYAANGPTSTSTGRPFQYQNASSFQIICAGRDGKFGSGSFLTADNSHNLFVNNTWTPASARGDTTDPGFDDLASFYSNNLGIPQP
jgi:prepilin-type N-terminal cleavage/methylation domain-containing protein